MFLKPKLDKMYLFYLSHPILSGDGFVECCANGLLIWISFPEILYLDFTHQVPKTIVRTSDLNFHFSSSRIFSLQYLSSSVTNSFCKHTFLQWDGKHSVCETHVVLLDITNFITTVMMENLWKNIKYTNLNVLNCS